MKNALKLIVATIMAGLILPSGLAAAAAAPVAAATSEDARLTAFLDAEFADWVKQNPQLATRLGIKAGGDKWNDPSEKTAADQVAWRQASAARMKAQFDRAKLSPEAQVNYDIWALEADRAKQSFENRIYRPPFYSRLYSAHSQLPDFLVNTHNVTDVTDLNNYIARLRGIPAILDSAIERSTASSRAGIRAPKFQIETIISGSEKLTSGAPFGPGADSALWADIKSKTDAPARWHIGANRREIGKGRRLPDAPSFFRPSLEVLAATGMTRAGRRCRAVTVI